MIVACKPLLTINFQLAGLLQQYVLQNIQVNPWQDFKINIDITVKEITVTSLFVEIN